MFSRLLQFARPFITFRKQSSLADPKAETKPSTTAMVTTRRQSESNSNPTANTSTALKGSSPNTQAIGSKKRTLPQAEDESTSQTAQDGTDRTISRKRKKLPVREKDEGVFARHAHIAIEIPVRDITQHDAPMWTAPERVVGKGKKQLADDTALKSEIHEADKDEKGQPEAGQILDPEDQNEVRRASLLHDTPEKTVKERGRRKKVGVEPSKNERSSLVPTKASITSITTKPKHKRFASVEPAAEECGLEVEEADLEEDDESSDDDDDAPEVVATHDAQDQATTLTRSAAKAVGEQDAAMRKKRKERDTQLKEQAYAASKKQKRSNKGEEEHVISTFSEAGENESRDESSRSASKASKDHPNSSSSRITVSRTNLPEYLPVEYLEDDPITKNAFSQSNKTSKVNKSKKIKFIDPSPKKPKDRTRGSTVYRVAEATGSDLLAPKAAINAQSVKEAWLNGQRGAGGSRKIIKGGFFKNRRQ